jgi:hypothetical protein
MNTEEKLFAASGLHFYEGQEAVDEEVDINTVSFGSAFPTPRLRY